MRLAVLDTNIVVSAGIKREGAPATIVMDWVLDGQVQIVTCPTVVDGYREVVRRAKFLRYRFPPLWLEFLIAESMQLPDPANWPHSLQNSKDAPLLALAHKAGAWLVTGNLRHFPREARSNVTVLSPAEYLARLRGRAESR
jgi:putative PIN family toxin of toxin-antitoxin system